jgi:hypothetical protein
MHRFTVFLLILLVCLPTNARLRDFVNVERFTGRNLGTWSAGDGDLSWSNLKCVASSNYNNAYSDPPPSVSPPAVHEAYRLRITDTAPSAGFYLYLDDDTNNTGNARLPASFQHRDVKAGTNFETLEDGVYDSDSHTGQFKNCSNGPNSEIEMTVIEPVLENARAGRYRGRFQVEVEGAGGRTHSRNLVMTLNVAEIVRVSELNNVELGNWSGSGDMSGDETFCVYSNNDAAGYSIDFSSPNQSGGTFRLANGGATEFVGYTLEFADSVAGVGTSVTGLAIPGSGNNSAVDCGGPGQVNAKISVTVTALDLGAATPDAYSDTLTMMVAPI